MHHTLFEEHCSVFISLNAILQFVGDVILEAMGLIPPRINHLSLTFINAFIAFKTLSAIHKDKFRFLHEDCQIFFLLEILLIVGDVYYAFKDDWGRDFIYIRLFFVCCSTFNWAFVTYIMVKYKLYHITYQGHTDDENKSFIHEDENNSDNEDGKAEQDEIKSSTQAIDLRHISPNSVQEENDAMESGEDEGSVTHSEVCTFLN